MESKKLLTFYGNGSKYFGISIVNLLLMIITLGIYYPWAKANKLKYLYSEADFMGSRFAFHGTGKEIFKGFLKLILFIVIIYALLFLFIYLSMPILGFLFIYLAIFAIVPLAIHGSLKYRMSRTSWRGIHFGYRGELKELNKIFYKNLFLTIITFGIYGAWMAIKLRNYTLSNVRFGNIKVDSNANGGDYFAINLKGYFLSLFTLGIYSFWWINESFEFYVNHLSLNQNEKKINLKASSTGGGFFKLLIGNFFIVLFTLGLGSPWTDIRTMRYIMSNIEFQGEIDADSIVQTESNYNDATGDDASDFFDIGII
jgi:uncharacterized membrane protein YjgN (DUF898 family)